MPTSTGGLGESQLVLGWRVTSTLEPSYWRDGTPRAGFQSIDQLFTVPATAMATHTAIFAQSGSGKSAFLGRIVEEILLQTKSRCLVLDPNADFRKVSKVEPASLWRKAQYNRVTRAGKLPHEKSRQEFAGPWSKVSIRIRTGPEAIRSRYERLEISWPSLSMDFLSEELHPMLRGELYHCHALVKTIGDVLYYEALATNQKKNLISEAKVILRRIRQEPNKELIEHALRKQFSADSILSNKRHVKKDASTGRYRIKGLSVSKETIERTIDRFIESALSFADYVTEPVERFYFGKAREYDDTGILQLIGSKRPKNLRDRLEVVDLPSFSDQGTRLLAINAVLTSEWERARFSWEVALDGAREDDSRVPTFVIVDEAHNLIPAEPRSNAETALREQFRTLVAEGRKYGLFLVLVSQRPDKLDPLILSECENKAVMRLGSDSVLNLARQMLGLQELPPKLLEKCLEFEVGRALMVGRWAPSRPEIMYAAARRTSEGGRNLREQFWALPASASKTISTGRGSFASRGRKK